VVTPGCVQATVVDAADRGYTVLLAADGCAAPAPDEHEFALSYMNNRFAKVLTVNEIARMVGSTTTKDRTRRAIR
jgi:nicotinamidase-related amidase